MHTLIFLVSNETARFNRSDWPLVNKDQEGSHGERAFRRREIHCQHCGNVSFGESAKDDSDTRAAVSNRDTQILKACRPLLESRAIGTRNT